MNRIQPLTLKELAELEWAHRSPAARTLLTEIWRLRLIESEAEQLVRMLANEYLEYPGVVGTLVRGLRRSLGLPPENDAVRHAPKPENGVWQSYRVETTAHRAKANHLGRALTPMEWGEIADRDS